MKISNPYPIRYRLPGDLTLSRRHLKPVEGRGRECIVHALTFHGIPPQIDDLIDKLPAQEELEALNPLRRDYLSFTVYSLKQMVAAGTVSADTAWSLFYGEWGRIESVAEDNFKGMREAFMQETIKLGDLPEGLSLLELEFYARAGEKGLAQYERYGEWAERLVFEGASLSEPVKEEYRKALWLEMRIIEGQVGIRGLNRDVGRFIRRTKEGYFSGYGTIAGSIDIFARDIFARSNAIDSTIKAEIGHWMFDLLYYSPEGSWVSELMDRMNIIGYTERINAWQDNSLAENPPPEVRTFREGGYYLSSGPSNYPTYPEECPEERIDKSHEIAEYVEKEIRKRVIRAIENNEVRREDTHKIYREIGLYIALLNLEGEPKEKILNKIESFNLKEIDEYYDSYLEKAIPALEKALKDGPPIVRAKAANALIKLKRLQEGSEEYKRYADQLKKALKKALNKKALNDDDNIGRCEAAEALGEIGDKSAVPALKKALNDKSAFVREAAAGALIKLKGLPKGSKGYEQLYAYQLWVDALTGERERGEVIKLGKSAIPALKKALLNDYEYRWRAAAAEALGMIGDKSAIPALKKALKDEDFFVKGAAAEALIKIRGLREDSEEYKQLYAYQLIGKLKWREIIKLGESAIPVLKKALNDCHGFRREAAAEALGEIGDKSVIPALEKALDDRSAFVREAAAEALRKLKGL